MHNPPMEHAALIRVTERINGKPFNLSPWMFTIDKLSLQNSSYLAVYYELNQNKFVSVIDLKKLSNITIPTTLDNCLIHPSEPHVALRAHNLIEVFDFLNNKTLYRCPITQEIKCWAWGANNNIRFFSNNSLHELNILTGAITMVFSLSDVAQQIFFGIDSCPNNNFYTLQSYSAQNNFLLGRLFLYSQQLNQIQTIDTMTSRLFEWTPPSWSSWLENANTQPKNSIWICYPFQSTNSSYIQVTELLTEGVARQASDQPPPMSFQLDFLMQPTSTSDYVVLLQFSHSHSLLYAITRYGMVYVFDFLERVLLSQIGIASLQEAVVLAALSADESTLVVVTNTTRILNVSLDLPALLNRLWASDPVAAASLAYRFDMSYPPAHWLQHSDALLRTGNCEKAARLTILSDKLGDSVLRLESRLHAMTDLLGPDNRQRLGYFANLTRYGSLNPAESMHLIKLLISMNNIPLIYKILSFENVICNKEIGDLLIPISVDLAFIAYTKAKSLHLAIKALSEVGKGEDIIKLCKAHGYISVDWIEVIENLCNSNRSAAVLVAIWFKTEASTLPIYSPGATSSAVSLPSRDLGNSMCEDHTTFGPFKDIDSLIFFECFKKRKLFKEATEFVLKIGKDASEDAELQTQVLEMNVKVFPLAVIQMLQNRCFSHFDRYRVACACEQHAMFAEALNLFSDWSDQRRILFDAVDSIPVELVVSTLSGVEYTEAISYLKEIMPHSPAKSIEIIEAVIKQRGESLDIEDIISALRSADNTVLCSQKTFVKVVSCAMPYIKNKALVHEYIVTCASLDRIQEAQQVILNSDYDPEALREDLMEHHPMQLNLLETLCVLYGYFEHFTSHLLRHEQYDAVLRLLAQHPTAISPIFKTVLDHRVNDQFVLQILDTLRSNQPLDPLLSELESRGRLSMLRAWLEKRADNGDKNTYLHTALVKISAKMQLSPQKVLLSNPYYDHEEVAKYCASWSPELAFLAYRSSKGRCDTRMVTFAFEQGLLQPLAEALISMQKPALWDLALKYVSEEYSQHKAPFINCLKANLQDAGEKSLALMISAFRGSPFKFHEDLISILHTLLFLTKPHPFSSRYQRQFEDLLINIAIDNHIQKCNKSDQNTYTRLPDDDWVKAGPPIWSELELNWLKPQIYYSISIMSYIKQIDILKSDQLVKRTLSSSLYLETYLIYKKGNNFAAIVDLLADHIFDGNMSFDMLQVFSDLVQLPEVDVAVARRQLSSNDMRVPLKNLIRAQDPAAFREVLISSSRIIRQYFNEHVFMKWSPETPVSTVEYDFLTLSKKLSSLESANQDVTSMLRTREKTLDPSIQDPMMDEMISLLVEYLLIVRAKIFDARVDSELLLCLCLTHRLPLVIRLLESPNQANVIAIADRLLSLHFYCAAHLLYSSAGNLSKQVSTSIALLDLTRAYQFVESAKIHSLWYDLFDVCLRTSNFKLAENCAMHLLTDSDEVALVLKGYIEGDFINPLIQCFEKALEKTGLTLGAIFSELALLYVYYSPEKLSGFAKQHHNHINISSLILACNRYSCYGPLPTLYCLRGDVDASLEMIMKHPSSYDEEQFINLLTQTTNKKTLYGALEYCFKYRPRILNKVIMMLFDIFDPDQVMTIAQKHEIVPLLRQYLQTCLIKKPVRNILATMVNIYTEERDLKSLGDILLRASPEDARPFVDTLANDLSLSMRCLAAKLYAHLNLPGKAINLLTMDNLLLESIFLISSLNRKDISENALEHHLMHGSLPIVLLILYCCFDTLSPSRVLSLAWLYNKIDCTIPYWVEYLSSCPSSLSPSLLAMISPDKMSSDAPSSGHSNNSTTKNSANSINVARASESSFQMPAIQNILLNQVHALTSPINQSVDSNDDPIEFIRPN